MSNDQPSVPAVTLQMSVRVSKEDALQLMRNLAKNDDRFSINWFAPPAGILKRAKWLLEFEIKRRSLPEITSMLGDPTWTLLLDLFIRDADGKPTTVSSAVIGTGLAPTTALRHLDILTLKGYVQRRKHPNDERMVLVSLTPAGGDRITEVLKDFG